MNTKIISIEEGNASKEALKEAGEIIKNGGLVAFPTETVYGLGGNALDETASEKIYRAKGRPSDNPLIVHICRMEDIFPIVEEVPETAKKLADEDRMRYVGGQYYVKSEEEMKGLFPYAWDAVENTQRIADRCHVEIEFGVTKLPHFEVPEGYDSWSYLNKLCYDGLRERYGKWQGKDTENGQNRESGFQAGDGFVFDENAPAGDTGQTLKERLDY